MDTSQALSKQSETRRKHSSTACESCRARKTRCVGGTPCVPCAIKNIPCTFGESEDGRRGRKRHLEELSTRADALETILSSIRSSDEESPQELLKLARVDRPVEELVQVAKKILTEDELRGKSRARLRYAVISIASLTDDPPIRVSAFSWTRITDDDDAVSHLVSVYFTWHHCTCPSMDQDLFVRDMNSKDLSSQFCSPLLVNSILMVASMYTDHPSAFADPGDLSTRGVHFMEEAARLWKLEEGKASLTNLQAFSSLICGAVFMGKDRVGALYANESIALATELVKHVKKSVKQEKSGYGSREFQRSYSSAVWGAFIIQTEIAVALMKPLDLRLPTVPPPHDGRAVLQKFEWQPYPKSDPAVKFFPLAINDEKYRLYMIAAKLLPLILSGNPEDSPLPGHAVLDPVAQLDRLVHVEEMLLKWYRHLPPEVKVEVKMASPAAGPLLDLHLAYHGFHITTQSLVLRKAASTDPDRVVAKGKIIRACESIANLFQCLRQTIGLRHFCVHSAHASALCALNLIEFLTEPGISATFHTVVVVMNTVARRWTLARGALKMLWIILQERKLDFCLSTATMRLFKLNVVDNWRPQDYRLFEMCSYPNYAAIGDKGRDFIEMGELLQEYAALHLDDGVEENTSTK